MPPRQTERGFVLIIVLWGVGLLAAVALAVSQNARLNSKATHNVVSNATAAALAEAAVHIALMEGISVLYRRTPLASPKIRVDGTPVTCSLPEGAIAQIQIWDEGGKIDLNASPDDLLTQLFVGLGKARNEAKSLANAIIDYRDTDQKRTSGGPESSAYRQAQKGYGPKNWQFESILELQQVPGITPELYQAVEPHVTIYSRHFGFDRKVAPRGLAALIGGSQGGGGDERESFDVPKKFLSPTAQSSFKVRAAVLLENGGRFVREAVIVVVSTSGGAYDFRVWKRGENVPDDFAGAGGDVLPAC